MVDLLVLWAWEYDADFIALMQMSAAAVGIQLLCLGPDDVLNVESRLASGEIQARALLDRVWDWGGEYEQHVPVARVRSQGRASRTERSRARERVLFLLRRARAAVQRILQLLRWDVGRRGAELPARFCHRASANVDRRRQFLGAWHQGQHLGW